MIVVLSIGESELCLQFLLSYYINVLHKTSKPAKIYQQQQNTIIIFEDPTKTEHST